MKNYFNKLYLYNQWANTHLMHHLRIQTEDLPEVMQRISHLVAAEEIWYQRIDPLDFDLLPLFEIQPWEVLEPRLIKSAQRWLELVAITDDFRRIISYHTTSGTPYQTSLEDILIHVANHGTYHRGQIATLMRQSGQEPMATDYIVFCRN